MSKQNVSGNLAVKGYDVTAYFDGEAELGDPAIALEYEGARFYFVNEESKKRFEASPNQFVPAYGGFCAYAMSNATQFDVDPRSFKVVDDRLFLFYDGVGGKTIDLWNQNEAERLEKADENWHAGNFAPPS